MRIKEQNTLRQERDEKNICTMLAFIILGIYIANIAACIEAILPVSQARISLMTKAFLGVCFIWSVPVILRRLNRRIVCVLLVSIISVLANLLFYPRNASYFKETVVTYYTMCFTAFVFATTVRDYALLKNTLCSASRAIAWFTLGLVCSLAMSGRLSLFNQGKYSMGLGYSLVLPAICLIERYSIDKRVKDAFGAASMVMVIIAFGSRGPLLGIACFASCRLLQQWVYERKYIRMFGVLTLCIVTVFFADPIMESGIQLLSKLGIQSRTLRLIMQKGIYLSGRDQVYEQLIEAIMQQPLAIRGINAEWLLLDVYAHNIFLELVYQFGVVIGGFVGFIIIVGILKTVENASKSHLERMRFMFMCSSIPALMFSGSLWTNYGFWIWVALVCITERTENVKGEEVGVTI